MLPVVFVDLFDHAELIGLVQAALNGEVALVPVGEQQVRRRPNAFELRVPGLRPVVLLGEPDGDVSAGMIPVRLRPFDDAHAGQLLVLACSASDDPSSGVAEKYAPGRWEMLSVVDRLEVDGGGALEIDLPPPSQKPYRKLSTVPHVNGMGEALSSPPRLDSHDPLVGRSVAGGKYIIEVALGAGATGIVYRAQQVALRRAVAIKVMHAHFRAAPGFAQRFHAEALAASKLDHPNVLRVLDFGEEPDGLLYLVMELVTGKELRALLNERALGRDREIEVMIQVCSALAAAHESGIVHRDIKPENVIIATGADEDGRVVDVVKVCDFGLATVESPRAGKDDGSLAASAVNLVAGTPHYMAPEQIRGERLDGRADLYAVGVMLFEIGTRRLPFDGESAMDVVQMQLYTEPPRPRTLDPRVDPRLEKITLRALAKSRDSRYPTARDLRADLRALIDARAETRDVQRTSVPLESPESGFLELFIALTAGLAPAGVRDDVERERTLERLSTATRTAIGGRGEVRFLTRAVDGRDLRVQSGTGETYDIRALVGQTAEPYVRRLVDVFAQHEVACLALKEGVGRPELADLVWAFETAFSPREVITRLRERTGRGVVVIATTDLVGATQPHIPRSVDLALTRIAFDLAGAGGAALAGRDAAPFHASVLDVTAGLTAPELRSLVTHLDYVRASLAGLSHLARVDVRRAVLHALSTDHLAEVAQLVLDEMSSRAGISADFEGGIARALAEILVARDDPDSYDLLRSFYEVSVLQLSELPIALREWADAELLAFDLSRDAVRVLGRLQGIPELPALASELERVRRAMRVLARREDNPGLWATAARLRELSGGVEPGDASHEALAARAADTIREPDVLAAIAEALLRGTGDQRNAGIGILRFAGSAGARALITARERLGDDSAVRGRFIAALRAVGDTGVAVVAEQLAQLAAQGPRSNPHDAEDLLRALPERPFPKLGPIIGEFLRHEAPAVRRAATHMMASTLGPPARDSLVSALNDTDDGVRIAALAGLREAGLIDGLAVSRIDRILNAGSGASEELRAAAAGALGAVSVDARVAAVDVLRRALRPVRSSFMAMLKDAAGSPGESVLVLTTIGRVLIGLAGPLGKSDVEARARASRGEIKKALYALIGVTP
ncbi:MAG: protein kinase [Myxococcales bacterium]|nr:protein kinase [Myxococcales bacterium]